MSRIQIYVSELAIALAITFSCPSLAVADEDQWSNSRSSMLRTILSHAASVPKMAGFKGISAPVMKVIGKLPRHRFVPKKHARSAYDDTPLPIGYAQTISQPFIVALMTELLNVGSDSTVLEIGTGSGYQAAVLAGLTKKVCTIEIISKLGKTASRRLKGLGYENVQTRISDGYFGWEKCGPFDGIIVTAAAGHVPPPLVKQLKPGGRMVIPVGSVFGPQYLTVIKKMTDGKLQTHQLLPVRFVPLTRGSK